MARRRAAAVEVPQTDAEAVELLGEYVANEHATLRERIVAEALIVAIKSKLDTVVIEREAQQKGRFAALKAWWEAGGREHAGKGRSTELAGAKIGFRVTPHKVKFVKGFSAEKALAWLKGITLEGKAAFIRTKDELDKAAIIKAIQADEAKATIFAPALSVVQTDEFFIDVGLDAEAIREELASS